jgi:hypothetical protein
MSLTGSARAALALACTATALGAAAQSPEREVDASAFLGPVPLQYGDHTVNAALANPLEVDSFTFAGLAGDSIMIRLRAFTGGVEPVLTLRGPGGGIVGSAGCGSQFGFACSLSLSRTLAGDGAYTINVADTGADEQGDYEVHLDRYPPVNNWLGIGYGTSYSDALAHPTDMDFFGFVGNAGTGVRVTSSVPGPHEPQMDIWDPNGLLVYSSFCGNQFGFPCSNTKDLDLTVSGIYRVAVSEAALDEAGTYTLQINCLYGDCPLPSAPPPVPVPEPGRWLTLALGLGALGLRLRRRR